MESRRVSTAFRGGLPEETTAGMGCGTQANLPQPGVEGNQGVAGGVAAGSLLVFQPGIPDKLLPEFPEAFRGDSVHKGAQRAAVHLEPYGPVPAAVLVLDGGGVVFYLEFTM